jgi:hypothetical protein
LLLKKAAHLRADLVDALVTHYEIMQRFPEKCWSVWDTSEIMSTAGDADSHSVAMPRVQNERNIVGAAQSWLASLMFELSEFH